MYMSYHTLHCNTVDQMTFTLNVSQKHQEYCLFGRVQECTTKISQLGHWRVLMRRN